jgi:hypothetical protein
VSDSAEHFEEYAKVELMGHSVLIARVTKAPIGDFIRCDVLAGDGSTVYTKLVNPKSVYAINLVSRDAAIALAKTYEATPPVQRYELPSLPAPATAIDTAEDELPEGWNGDGR